MAEFIVTNGNDSGTGSLRDAIAQANTLPGADEIRFDGVNIIDLTTGSLNITDTVTISGQNSHITVQRDSGATDFRIFNVTGGVTTTFDNLTIANGQTADSGAGINSDGAITLLNSNVTGNTSGDRGGGLYTRAAMITLTNSTVSNNSATDNGGGLYNRNSLVEITNSTVANNSSNRYGGGVHTRGQIIVADSTVSNNSSRRNGAGIYSRSGNITVSDSTISDNSSNRHGGGLWARSRTITLERSTVSGNSSRISAGGTYASTTNITESIISNNTSGDLGGGVYTTGALRITDSTISGNSSANKGGGVYFRNYAEILRSTISGNSSNRGGGLYSRGGGTVSISNSTISGNAVSNHGGGLFARGRNGGTITFFNATLTQNSAAGNGGGIFQNGGGLGLQNSIVAGNQDGTGLSPDISGSNIVGNNNNILGTVAGANNSTVGTGSDKVLSGLGISIATVLNPNLADNGGSTQTHALVDGSIAIDGAGAGATTEGQRQIGAVGTRDIGAFELRNQEINVTGNSVAIANNDTTPDTADDTDFGGVNVNSGSITKTFTIENQGDLPLG
ncbi:MAG: choice-of-anchor Q domain-containing protein, partial [Cyanobacteria bacterium P01_C01_bin.89]